MDIEAAKLIVEVLEENNKRLFSLLPQLAELCEADELEKLKRDIARVANGIDMNLYPLVLSQYPELDPLKEK
ncbi:hypothetical protein [Oceanicoccus sp. KOV_DT_Chl]|uniref:hypothetical protein n=1 Tax=Oceanicoccus sp. KOV_DT_Chl TaxID=1904639 RepID=UPI000C7BAA96|nr:hypothetical protein [Oceanicoccus sp. KOV_DT_Chl]